MSKDAIFIPLSNPAAGGAGGGGGGGEGMGKSGMRERSKSKMAKEDLERLASESMAELAKLLEAHKQLDDVDMASLTDEGKDMKRVIRVGEVESLLEKIAQEKKKSKGLVESLSELVDEMRRVANFISNFGYKAAAATAATVPTLVTSANSRFQEVPKVGGPQGLTSPFANRCQLILCFKDNYKGGAGSNYEGNAKKFLEDGWTGSDLDNAAKSEFCEIDAATSQHKLLEDLTNEVARLELFAVTADTKALFNAAKENVVTEFLAPRYAAFKEAMESGLSDESFMSEGKLAEALAEVGRNLSKEERRTVLEGTYVLTFGRANKKDDGDKTTKKTALILAVDFNDMDIFRTVTEYIRCDCSAEREDKCSKKNPSDECPRPTQGKIKFVDYTDLDKSALHMAAVKDKTDGPAKDSIIDFLVTSCGASLIPASAGGVVGCYKYESALHTACKHGNVNAVKRLVSLAEEHTVVEMRPLEASEKPFWLSKEPSVTLVPTLVMKNEQQQQQDSSSAGAAADAAAASVTVVTDEDVIVKAFLNLRDPDGGNCFTSACAALRSQDVLKVMEHLLHNESWQESSFYDPPMLCNTRQKDGSSSLILVAKASLEQSKTRRGLAVVERLLSCKGIDAASKNLKGETALHYVVNIISVDGASMRDQIIKHLASAGKSIDAQDFSAPLTNAVLAKNDKAVEGLIRTGFIKSEDKRKALHDVLHEKRFKTLALLDEYGDVFISKFKEEYEGDEDKEGDDESIVKHMAVNPRFFLEVICERVGTDPFFFSIYLQVLEELNYSVEAFNRTLPTIFTALSQTKFHDDLLHQLLQLGAVLKEASEKFPAQRFDYLSRVGLIEAMALEILGSNSMDDSQNVKDVLCRGISVLSVTYENELVGMAQAFYDGPLKLALENELTAIFSTAQLSTFVDRVFWGSLQVKDKNDESGVYSISRYTPIVMLVLEGTSKFVFLAIVSLVSVVRYTDDALASADNTLLPSESFLIVMLFTSVLYEVGDILGDTMNTEQPEVLAILARYLDVWNMLDVASLGCVFVWACLRSIPEQRDNGRGFLAVSAIPFSLGLLAYMSVIEQLGTLVIILFAMARDLLSFLIIFVVCIFGFAVAMRALYQDTDAYANNGQTIMTLVDAVLGSHDSTVYEDSYPFVDLGLVLEYMFILLTSVVLINLLIAKMSTTFADKSAASFREWQMMKADTTLKHLLVGEKSVFCILPPPFNLLTTFLYPIHRSFVESARQEGRDELLTTLEDNRKEIQSMYDETEKKLQLQQQFEEDGDGVADAEADELDDEEEDKQKQRREKLKSKMSAKDREDLEKAEATVKELEPFEKDPHLFNPASTMPSVAGTAADWLLGIIFLPFSALAISFYLTASGSLLEEIQDYAQSCLNGVSEGGQEQKRKEKKNGLEIALMVFGIVFLLPLAAIFFGLSAFFVSLVFLSGAGFIGFRLAPSIFRIVMLEVHPNNHALLLIQQPKQPRLFKYAPKDKPVKDFIYIKAANLELFKDGFGGERKGNNICIRFIADPWFAMTENGQTVKSQPGNLSFTDQDYLVLPLKPWDGDQTVTKLKCEVVDKAHKSALAVEKVAKVLGGSEIDLIQLANEMTTVDGKTPKAKSESKPRINLEDAILRSDQVPQESNYDLIIKDVGTLSFRLYYSGSNKANPISTKHSSEMPEGIERLERALKLQPARHFATEDFTRVFLPSQGESTEFRLQEIETVLMDIAGKIASMNAKGSVGGDEAAAATGSSSDSSIAAAATVAAEDPSISPASLLATKDRIETYFMKPFDFPVLVKQEKKGVIAKRESKYGHETKQRSASQLPSWVLPTSALGEEFADVKNKKMHLSLLNACALGPLNNLLHEEKNKGASSTANSSGRLPLHLAAARGDPDMDADIIKSLLDFDHSAAGKTDNACNFPLFYAICEGFFATPGTGIYGGVKLESNDGSTSITQEEAEERGVEIIKLLLKAYPEATKSVETAVTDRPELQLVKRKETALLVAVKKGLPLDAIKALSRANPDAAGELDEGGNLAIHIAANYLSLESPNDIEYLEGVMHILLVANPHSATSYDAAHKLVKQTLEERGKRTLDEILAIDSQSADVASMEEDLNRLLSNADKTLEDEEIIVEITKKLEEPKRKLARSNDLSLNLSVAIPDDKTRCLPLHLIDEKTSLKKLEKMLAVYPEACKQCDVQGRLPLHYLVARKFEDVSLHEDMVKRLIAVYPEAVSCIDDVGGDLPLHCALHVSAPVEIIRVLLEKSKDEGGGAQIKNKYDEMPLTLSCVKCTDAVEDVLRKYPKATAEADRYDRLPIHLAAESKAKLMVIKNLIEAYPNGPKMTTTKKKLPLHYACAVGTGTDVVPGIVTELLKAYPQGTNCFDDGGSIPLHLALDNRATLEVIESLIESYPDKEEEEDQLQSVDEEAGSSGGGGAGGGGGGAGGGGRAAKRPSITPSVDGSLRSKKRFGGGASIKDREGMLALHIALAAKCLETSVSSDLLRPSGAAGNSDASTLFFKEGDTVEGNYRSRGRWLTGKIVKIRENLTYDVEYAISNEDDNVSVILRILSLYPRATFVKDVHDNWPLTYALSSPNPSKEIVIALLAASKEVEKDVLKEKDGESVVSEYNEQLFLHSAIENHCELDIVTAIHIRDPEAIKKVDKRGRLPLHVFTITGCTEKGVLEFLLKNYRKSLEIMDLTNSLPLHCSMNNSDTGPDGEVRKMLILDQYKAAVLVQDSDGLYPLHVALTSGLSNKLIFALLQAEKELRKGGGGSGLTSVALTKTKSNQYALHLAAENKCSSEIIKALLEIPAQGADNFSGMDVLQEEDNDGNTPLHLACVGRVSLEMINLLLKEGRERENEKLCSVVNALGQLPIHLLTQQNMDIGMQNTDSEGKLDIHTTLHLLLESHQESAEAVDDFRRTPLHYAAAAPNVSLAVINDIHHHSEVVEQMVDCEGKTALQIYLEKQPSAINAEILKVFYDSCEGTFMGTCTVDEDSEGNAYEQPLKELSVVHLACLSRNASLEVIQFLLRKLHDLEEKGYEKPISCLYSPLQIALLRNRSVDILQVLVFDDLPLERAAPSEGESGATKMGPLVALRADQQHAHSWIYVFKMLHQQQDSNSSSDERTISFPLVSQAARKEIVDYVFEQVQKLFTQDGAAQLAGKSGGAFASIEALRLCSEFTNKLVHATMGPRYRNRSIYGSLRDLAESGKDKDETKTAAENALEIVKKLRAASYTLGFVLEDLDEKATGEGIYPNSSELFESFASLSHGAAVELYKLHSNKKSPHGDVSLSNFVVIQQQTAAAGEPQEQLVLLIHAGACLCSSCRSLSSYSRSSFPTSSAAGGGGIGEGGGGENFASDMWSFGLVLFQLFCGSKITKSHCTHEEAQLAKTWSEKEELEQAIEDGVDNNVYFTSLAEENRAALKEALRSCLVTAHHLLVTASGGGDGGGVGGGGSGGGGPQCLQGVLRSALFKDLPSPISASDLAAHHHAPAPNLLAASHQGGDEIPDIEALHGRSAPRGSEFIVMNPLNPSASTALN